MQAPRADGKLNPGQLGTKGNPYRTRKAALEAGYKKGDDVYHKYGGKLRSFIPT